MTARPIIHHLEIPSCKDAGVSLPFEMQPIAQLADSKVVAYELLYRGPRPADWAHVDQALIRYLGVTHQLPPVFVNLSNDVLMSNNFGDFIRAIKANDITFELSESLSGYTDRVAIADKVNRLIDSGARMALDDFGAGRDGFERFYAIRNVAAVKIDREFLLTCMRRQDAARMLSLLISQWRNDGVQSIAEGVENEAMLTFARTLNVDLVQGWFIDAMVARNR